MSAVQELAALVGNPQTIIGDDKAVLVKSLIAQYARLGEEETKIAESRAAVRDLLVSMYAEGTTDLVIGDKVYATYKAEIRTYLKTDAVKKTFPQAEFPDLYEDTVSNVFRLKKVKED